MNNKFVPEALRKAAGIYEERNQLYGSNYKQFGKWVSELFPDGIVAKTPEDFNRLGIIIQMLSKISRYAQNFENGGHSDSLDDLAVYSMMLQELDAQARKKDEGSLEPQVFKNDQAVFKERIND